MLQSMGLQRVRHDWTTKLTDIEQIRDTANGLKKKNFFKAGNE